MVAAPFELKHSGFFWLSPGIGCCELSVCLFTGRVGRIDIWIATIRGLFFSRQDSQGRNGKKRRAAERKEERKNWISSHFFHAFKILFIYFVQLALQVKFTRGMSAKKCLRLLHMQMERQTDRHRVSTYVCVWALLRLFRALHIPSSMFTCHNSERKQGEATKTNKYSSPSWWPQFWPPFFHAYPIHVCVYTES